MVDPFEVLMNHILERPYPTLEGTKASSATHLRFYDLVADRQRRAYNLVRERHILTAARLESRNSALSGAL